MTVSHTVAQKKASPKKAVRTAGAVSTKNEVTPSESADFGAVDTAFEEGSAKADLLVVDQPDGDNQADNQADNEADIENDADGDTDGDNAEADTDNELEGEADTEPEVAERRVTRLPTARRPRTEAEDMDAQGPSADLVRVYLNGIGKTALLTAEQEVELAKRIEAGVFAQHKLESSPRLSTGKKSDLRAVIRDGGRARSHLLVANLRLVVSLAKRYTGRGMPLLDLIQEGNLGLIRAVEKFDYTQGFQVLDVRHLVDPTGHQPRNGRSGPHHPAARPSGGAGQQAVSAEA